MTREAKRDPETAALVRDAPHEDDAATPRAS
jgi:hypothetical protein